MRILANEFVLPIRDGRECHASHFVLLNEGQVFCVYFYGTKEGKDDVRIYGSLRTSDGRWSEPRPITEDDGLPHWNPVLLRCHDGRVILFYKVGKPIADWYTRYMVSTDNCRTWSESRELVEGDRSGGRGPVRNKAIYLRDGTVLAPGSTEQGEWKCFFDRSTDGGLTWARSEDICLPRELLFRYESTHKKGIIQPSLWQDDGGIHALMRSTEGAIFRTDSADAVTWCAPYAIDMPNNNSGIDLARLPDGRIILACNPVSDNWGARTPMSLFVSDDGGYHFSLLTHLTTMQGEYSYPALQYENGSLHITYTWNRKTVQYFCLSDL
ncbi:MAG: exo-alpha-sialidase [Clostridia bacterium]|nr:exo-alpha-sialidase [Clostridia bacterium]